MSKTPLIGLDILVAEDHYVVAAELASLLRKLGAAVVGPVARLPLEPCLASESIDMALLDVELCGGTSFPLADELAERGVPVALITGYAPDALPSAYRDLPRLDKPVERDKLTAAILRLTARTEGLVA